MATVTRHIKAPVDDVFAALADPNTYPEWLVGAKVIRSIDRGWPEPGSRFHHRVGLVGPLTIADSTESLEQEPGKRLVLEARARPAGRARVSFDLTPEPGGTLVVMDEVPVGPLAPLRPFLDPLTVVRNTKSLRELDGYLRSRIAPELR